MTAARELLDLVETKEFQRAMRTFQGRTDSLEYRVLKGLENLARGVPQRRKRASRSNVASGQPQRQSQKETTGNGNVQHLSV